MEEIDYWSTKQFEDELAVALISMFETKIISKHVKGLKIKDKDFRRYKSKGVYIPSNSRVFLMPEDSDSCGQGFFDTRNDNLPNFSFTCFSNLDGSLGSKAINFEANYKNCSSVLLGVRRVDSLPKGWTRRGKGQLYEHCLFVIQNKGIDGEKHYITVDKEGNVLACDFHLFSRPNIYGQRQHLCYEQDEPEILSQRAWTASYLMQQEADKRFCWSISAEESGAKVELGCMQEEVKSLLYARTAPITETGRKRPILHLVESHKRRIKNGTDIDITPFLRGTQKIEMQGTVFTVRAPKVKQPILSENSGRYYESN